MLFELSVRFRFLLTDVLFEENTDRACLSFPLTRARLLFSKKGNILPEKPSSRLLHGKKYLLVRERYPGPTFRAIPWSAEPYFQLCNSFFLLFGGLWDIGKSYVSLSIRGSSQVVPQARSWVSVSSLCNHTPSSVHLFSCHRSQQFLKQGNSTKTKFCSERLTNTTPLAEELTREALQPISCQRETLY